MSHHPHVSIGLPVYNGDRFLKEALDSLLAQTFTDFELIISDNGSTDKTPEICQTYAAQDKRIRYCRNEQNLGAGWNFNRVFELSTGEYFKWACHDDICARDFLQRCVEVLDCNPTVVLCYPQTIVINEYGQQVKKFFDDFNLNSSQPHQRFQQYLQLVRHGNECHPFHGLIRAKTLRTTSLVGSYPSSDLILLGQLALHGKFHEIPEFLFFKRDHPHNSVRAHRAFRERITWYNPAKKGKLYLTRWKWFLEYIAAIKRTDMNRSEKLRCYIQMWQWMSWNWLWLTKDLLKAATWPILQPWLNLEFNKKVTKNVPTGN